MLWIAMLIKMSLFLVEIFAFSGTFVDIFGNFQAMRAEMNEDYDKAAKILDSILDEDESNNQAKKRKIAMLKVK